MCCRLYQRHCRGDSAELRPLAYDRSLLLCWDNYCCMRVFVRPQPYRLRVYILDALPDYRCALMERRALDDSGVATAISLFPLPCWVWRGYRMVRSIWAPQMQTERVAVDEILVAREHLDGLMVTTDEHFLDVL